MPYALAVHGEVELYIFEENAFVNNIEQKKDSYESLFKNIV